MDNKFEKIVVAPQIVIYKNIFKKSKQLIEYVNSENCIFGDWNFWFEQGYRKGTPEYSHEILEKDSFKTIKEKMILKEFLDVVEFIRKDYFDDFGHANGIWPDFIDDWHPLLNRSESYDVDIFKWSDKLVQLKKPVIGEIMMPYHVDDWDRSAKNFAVKKNIVTLNVYLNDEYKGGEICAYDLNTNKSYVYKPGIGDAVVMPSHSPFYHAVKYFEGHDRYFIRTFFRYPHPGIIVEEEKVFEDIKDYVDKDLQIISVSAEEVLVK